MRFVANKKLSRSQRTTIHRFSEEVREIRASHLGFDKGALRFFVRTSTLTLLHERRTRRHAAFELRQDPKRFRTGLLRVITTLEVGARFDRLHIKLLEVVQILSLEHFLCG